MLLKYQLDLKSLLIVCNVLGLLLNVCQTVEINYNNPVVNTANGPVRGLPYHYTTTTNNAPKQVVAFTGVPYARPPTGFDRFAPPTDPDQWTTEVDATNRRVMCPQVEDRFEYTQTEQIDESEDCLLLNIYVPVFPQQFVSNLPVLVYFHGGEFKYGSKDHVKPDLLLDASLTGPSNGIIVVTANYRLGVLGFLSTDDVNIPGNNGIRDQVQALRWINNNIAQFNGNPQNVTIMGHDAGGIAVSMHVLNPAAWPYFNSAISIGGTVFTPWAFKDNPKDQAMNFANFFGCDQRSDKMLDCLRGQDRNALMGKSRDRDLERNVQPYWFRPVVDRNLTSSGVLKDWPESLYRNGQFKKCSYMIGFTRNEGSLEYYLQKERADNRRTNEEKIAFLIRPFLKEWASEDVIATVINYQYFGKNFSRNALSSQFANGPQSIRNNAQFNSLNNQMPYQSGIQNNYQSNIAAGGGQEYQNDQILVELMGDFLYIAPSDFVARLHSMGGGKVWVYAFEFEGTRSLGPIQKNAKMISKQTYGVTHMDDMLYAFNTPYAPDAAATERTLSSTYARMFFELTRFGYIPDVYNSFYQWRQYLHHQPSYLLYPARMVQPVSKIVPNNGEGYRTAQADFFNNVVYQLQDKTKIYPSPFPYSEMKGYKAATWSLMGFAVLLLILLIVVIVVLCFRRQKSNELKLLRKTDKEMEERFNTT